MSEKNSYKDTLQEIVKNSGVKLSDVIKVFKALQLEIAKSLVKGEVFRWGQFGHFRISILGARKMRNPQSGEVFQAPERKAVRFNAGSILYAIVNGKEKLAVLADRVIGAAKQSGEVKKDKPASKSEVKPQAKPSAKTEQKKAPASKKETKQDAPEDDLGIEGDVTEAQSEEDVNLDELDIDNL